MRQADAVVIGGGPAGAAAARQLASWGRRVVVIARSPSSNALAESLPPSCERLLERTGLAPAVHAAGFLRSTGNTVWWGGTPARREYFPAGTLGFQVARGAFDRLLLAEAARAGATVLHGASALHVDRPAALASEGSRAPAAEAGGSGRSVVRFVQEGRQEEIAAPWVVDCTGRAGLLARQGMRRPTGPARTVALVGVWEHPGRWALDDPTHTLVESHARGWSWSVPVTLTRRYVTAMVDPELTGLAGRARLTATYQDALAGSPRLHALSAGAQLVAGPFACEATPYSAARVTGDGVLLAGDAASFVDPLSSYGVKKALASAWLAAVVVNTALSYPQRTAPALALFERRERAMAEALQSRAGMLSRDAAAAHAEGYWDARTTVDDIADDAGGAAGEPDIAALRDDRQVRAAFEDIRTREALPLRAGAVARRERRPVVRGNVVVMEDHFVTPAFPHGVRWLRGVDVVLLADLAIAHREVPDVYDAYNRAAPPVQLPDFLGALSVLVGKGMLEISA